MDFGPILKDFLGPGDLQKVFKPFWLKNFRGQKGLRRFLSPARRAAAAAAAAAPLRPADRPADWGWDLGGGTALNYTGSVWK